MAIVRCEPFRDLITLQDRMNRLLDERFGRLRTGNESMDSGARLIDLWTKVKSRVWQLDIRDNQIAEWFRRNYHTDVRLSDFDLVEPPAQVTTESLEHFLKTLEHHADHL